MKFKLGQRVKIINLYRQGEYATITSIREEYGNFTYGVLHENTDETSTGYKEDYLESAKLTMRELITKKIGK